MKTNSFCQATSTGSDSQTEMLARLLNQVDREFVEVARRETNSMLRLRGYVGLTTLHFQEIIKEIQTLCPTVFSLLSQMILFDYNPEKRAIFSVSTSSAPCVLLLWEARPLC